MGFERQGAPEDIMAVSVEQLCLQCGHKSTIVVNGRCPMCQTQTPIDFEEELKKLESNLSKDGK